MCILFYYFFFATSDNLVATELKLLANISKSPADIYMATKCFTSGIIPAQAAGKSTCRDVKEINSNNINVLP